MRSRRAPLTLGATLVVAVPMLYAAALGSAGSRTMKAEEDRVVNECSSPIDLAVVLDVSGSMDDDTCCTGSMSNGCDQSWWSEIDEIIYEDFEGYTLGDGDADPDRLCGANSPWSCEVPWQVGARNDSNRYSGNYGMTEGDGNDGHFYMYFDASAYDQIEVVLRERTYSADSGDYNSVWYSRDGGGWTRIMNESGEHYWAWRAYLIPAQTSQFGIMFGSRYMESYDYGLWDEISIRGMVNGPELSGPLGLCPGYGGSDCAGGGFKKQPLWDTLEATDWLVGECQTDGGSPCLDPALDQVGLAYFSDDGNMVNYYPGSYDSATACELTSVYSTVTTALWTQLDAEGWTNMGDGIYRGLEVLSTNESEGHHGRTDAVHAMILLTDGIPNRPCPTGWSQWECEQPGTWPFTHTNSAVSWAAQNGVVIHTVGLGSAADPSLMAQIAEDTGGSSHYAASTNGLHDIMREIAEDLRCAPVRPDTDGDGLLDEDEYSDQCPYVDDPDSDDDGYLDGVEVFNGWDPCDPYDPNGPTPTSTVVPPPPPPLDTDGDGLPDEDEYWSQCPYVTNPDSDFDGIPDGVEVANGWDPCDPYNPHTPTPEVDTPTPTSTSTPTPTNTPTSTSTSTPTSTSTATATSTSTPTNTPTIWPVGYMPLFLKSY